MAPSRRQLVNLMIYFCCIHTAVFEGLIAQCRGSDYHKQDLNGGKSKRATKCKTTNSSSAPASIRRLFTLERLSQKYNLVLITYYVIFLLKTLATNLVSIGALAKSPLGLLDCFLMARARTFGRAHKLGPPIINLFYFMFLIYRCFLKCRTRRFKFQVLEFLLHDYDEVLANELKNQLDQEQRRRSLAFKAHQEKQRQFSSTTKHYLTKIDDNKNEINNKHEHMQFVQNSFKFQHLYKVVNAADLTGKQQQQQQQPEVELLIRPNRTSKSWQQLANFTLILFGLAIYTLIAAIIFALLTSVVPSVTTMGFEITYATCSRWLQRVQSEQYLELAGKYLPGGQWNVSLNESSVLIESLSGRQHQDKIVQPISYSYILMTLNKTLACDLPIEKAPIIVTLGDSPLVPYDNWYGLIRTTLDITFTFVFLIDFSLYFSATSYLLFITSYDVILNARSISARLAQLNKELSVRHLEQASRCLPLPLYDRTLAERHETLEPRPAEYQRHAHLVRETMAAQSILMDHFKLVLDYNQFTSYFLLLLHVSLFLLFFSLAISVFTLRNVAIELEFVIIELASVSFVIYLLAGATCVHQANARIHTQLSTAMALDETSAETKLRWITLIKYYSPMPLYCFNLFNKIEISHLFCLKLVSWCCSASLVVASFLYMYRTA